jgi:NADPH-dependent ferric siderophore reductase
MPPPNRPPRKPVQVTDVSRPTPRVVRVVVQGDLEDWPEPGAAAHTKIFLPDAPDGPVLRTYTVRDWNRERGEVTIDMAMNDGRGPATQWASRATPGMTLELGGRNRSGFAPSEAGGSYLFAGDETAVPAITTCVATLPPGSAATVILEVADAQEQQPLESEADLDIRWLYDDGKADFSASVLDAVAELKPTHVWVACEAQTMRVIRRALLDSGFPVSQMTTRGYWKRGDSNHPDHDRGEDVE